MTTAAIERYLRTRRVRYFRGHHDGEYFFIVTIEHRRLHVHLGICDDTDVLTIRIAPACYFPAAHRARLTTLVDTWNRRRRPASAVVLESCDPTRIGVVAESSHVIDSNTSYDELAALADRSIQSAVEFFEQLTPAVEPASASAFQNWVPDAG